MSMTEREAELIRHLKLEPHPIEGGYFRRIYESDIAANTPRGERKFATSIHYLLTSNSPIGYLHHNTSDIIHFYQLGAPMHYILVSPHGEVKTATLGPNQNEGHLLHLRVKGGYWKASYIHKNNFSLISEVVVPGFDYQDNTLATLEILKSAVPHLSNEDFLGLSPYIKNAI